MEFIKGVSLDEDEGIDIMVIISTIKNQGTAMIYTEQYGMEGDSIPRHV